MMCAPIWHLWFPVKKFPQNTGICATSMNLSTRDEIFSAMVVYGFLSYADGQICIPNK